MSLKRKDLSAMGLEPAQIDAIIEGHSETVNALQDEIEKLKNELQGADKDSEKLKEVQKELNDLKKKVEAEAKERAGKDYDKLKKEFDEYKKDIEQKAVRASKETAYKGILKDAGIPEKHWNKIIKYSDVDGVELDKDGKIKTAKDIMKSLKEEWSDHIETTGQKGVNTETPPANNTGQTGMTKEQIDAIEDTAERQKAMLANHELYGF